MMMGMFGFGFIGLLIMGLFWIGLILLVIWAARGLFNGSSTPSRRGEQDPTPREILDLRYSRGEITREQYEIMKKDLS